MTQEQMNDILQIGMELTSERDIHILLEKILRQMMAITHCDAGTIYLKNGDFLDFSIIRNNTLHLYLGGHGETIDIPSVPIDREHVSSLALIENRTIHILDAYDDQLETIFQGPRNYDSVTGYHTQSVLVVPMQNPSGEQIGVVQLINAMDEEDRICEFSEDCVAAMESIASQAAVAISNAKNLIENQEMFQSFVETMVAAVGTLTPYNENHTRNMVTYGKRFLKYLEGTPHKLSPERAHQLIMSIWLHDLGKLVTPISIMNKNTRLWPEQKMQIMHRLELFEVKAELMFHKGKTGPDEVIEIQKKIDELRTFVERADTNIISDRKEALERYISWYFEEENGEKIPYLTEEEAAQLSVMYRTLTDEEFEIMHAHVSQTDRLLSSIHFPSDMPYVRKWAAQHHELLNGKGYPNRLSGDEIAKEVRILTILDIFEALTASDREYKKPKTAEEAVAHLHRIAGFGEIDEELVALFEESRCWLA